MRKQARENLFIIIIFGVFTFNALASYHAGRYADRSMVSKNLLAENFADYTVGNDLVSEGANWFANAGDDENGTTITYDIVTKNSVPQVLLHDDDAGGNIDIYYDPPFDVIAYTKTQFQTGFQWKFKFTVDSAAGTSPELLIDIQTSSTTIIRINLKLNTGDIYYNSATDSGKNFNFGATVQNTLVIETVSTTQFKLIVNGEKTAALNNLNTWNADWAKTRFVTNTGEVDVDVYFDEISVSVPSVGMQWFTWQQHGSDITTDEVSREQCLELSNNSILWVSDQGVKLSLAADYSSPSTVISGNPPSGGSWKLWDVGSGVIYAWEYNADFQTAGEFKKSTNYGVDWANGGGVNLDANLLSVMLFDIAGTLYGIFIDESGANDVYEIWSYDGSSDWTSVVTYDAGAVSGGEPVFGHVDGTDFYFFLTIVTSTTTHYMKFDSDAGPATLASVGSIAGLSAQINDQAEIVNGVNRHVFLYDGTDYHLISSVDSGANWTKGSEVQTVLGIPIPIRNDQADSTDYKIWVFDSGTTGSDNIFYFDTNNNALRKIFDFGNVVGDHKQTMTISTSGVVFMNNVSDDTEVWDYTNQAKKIKNCVLYGFGNEMYRPAEWVISPNDKALFKQGDLVEFLDGFDVLAFRGNVIDNKFRRGIGQVITGMPLKGELLEEPKDTARSFSASATDTIVDAIVDAMAFLFENGEIDSNGDFTITYTIQIKTPIKDFIKIARELERAVFFVTPEGEVRMYAHDQIPATGLTWRDDTFKQIQLTDEFTRDMSITRSEVIGAYVQGTSDNVEVRRDYIGDATQETTRGVVRISLRKPQLTNDTEVLQLATNRYNIYGAEIQFVNVAPVKNQGFIQPGKSIDFSWSETNVTIDQGDYFIAKWIYNLKFDRYSEFWLCDSIITPEEYAKVRASIGRDNQISDTYHEGENETSGDGTVVVQNPVARLRAGASVWRLPEPSSADFAMGDLTDDTAWNELDLSSIIPSGVRVVRLAVKYTTAFVGDNILVRKNGQSNAIQVDGLYNQIANKPDLRTLETGVDDNGKCEIKVDRSRSNWTQIDITVVKWEL